MSNILVDDVFVDETNANAIFTVRLDVANANTVTVNYATADGTASYFYSPTDYVNTSGVLTFSPGQVVKTVSVPIINNAIAEATENFYLGLSSASANATIADAWALATITDNDAPSGIPVVSINDFTVDEATKEATFVITLNKPSTSVVSMNYATQNGTAVAGSDFVAKNGSLVFAPGETAKTVKVTLTNDAAFEASESFNLALSAITNATTLDAIGTAIIGENDAPLVSNSRITVDDIFVDESQTYADFLVRLDAPNTNAVTVRYDTADGTASYFYSPKDYVSTGQTLNFAPGETVKTVRVTLLDDAISEATKNFYLGLSSASANATIADAWALATITDNDAPSGTPVVSINDFTVDEATKEATFVITLNKPSTSVVSMNYATQNGTAVAGSDFVAKNGSLVFAPGETAKTVKVTLTNDAAFEASESFNLALSAITNATTLDAIGTAIIGENDAPLVSNSRITVDDIFVDESQTYADFLVRLDTPNTNAVTVRYDTADGTASYFYSPKDYVSTGQTLNFAPGETVKTVRVTLLDDAISEATKNFYLGLSSASANATIADAWALATITDNDAPSGTPVVSINDFTVDEATKEATFVITLNKPSTSVVSMNYATQNGTAVAGSDFVAKNGSLVFAPGETAKTVKVTLTNDAAFEASESFNLALSAITNATTLDAIGTAIIGENDAPLVSNSRITVDDIFVDESQTYADFLVRLDAPNTNAVTVRYDTADGTASYFYSPKDYVSTGQTLNFAPGETVKTVRVTLLDDAISEATKNFYLGLSSASANATIADAWALATITDNDAPSGTPVVSINDFTVDEATKEATFVITLNKPSTSVVSMNYATQNGTAVAGSDFVAKNGSLVFAPGETAKTVKVTLTNDAAFEASESFNLALSAITNATTLDAIGTAIIGENDAPLVSNSRITVDDIFVDESQTYADFLVRLDAPNTNAVTVRYDTADGTASYFYSPKDYVSTGQTLNFAPGETVKTVRVTLLDDAISEATKNFSLILSSPSANATIIKGARATIIDNDATTGTPTASIIDTVVDETDQTAMVTVVLNKPSTSWTSLDVAGQNITAVGSDYRALQIGKIAFAPGETEKTVTFGLSNDALVEGTELFDAVLANPVGVTLGDARAHAFIASNDNAAAASPIVHVANVAASEDKGYIDFLVTLSAPSVSGARVNYSTSAGTASSSSDFLSASGTLVFAPGEVARVWRIILNDDITAEALETFTFNLSGAVNATIGTASATASIIDNESAAPAPIAISGTTGNDILQGTQFADTLTGNAGNDTFNAGEGNDSMTGGAGNDIYLVENAGDTYTEAAGGGTDLVISYLATHTLGANTENLQLAGTATTGIGNSLNNSITGNGRNDTINGSLGNDILNGAAGSDIISGGTGTDFFVFNTALNAVTNVDTLTDFNIVDDTIRLENAIFAKFTATGAIAPDTLVAGPGAVALDSNDYLIYDTANGNLYYDADGSGVGVRVTFAALTGAPSLTAADFAII